MSDSKPENNLDRRKFLTVVDATGTDAIALNNCSTDRMQKLIPYLVSSKNQIPGIAKLADPQRLRSGWLNGVKELQVSYRG